MWADVGVLRQNPATTVEPLRMGGKWNHGFSPIEYRPIGTQTVERVPDAAGSPAAAKPGLPRRPNEPRPIRRHAVRNDGGAADFWARHDPSGAERIDGEALGRVL